MGNRVYLVEDSVLLRNQIRLAIESTDALSVIGSSSRATIAIHEIRNLRPDIAVIDLQLEEGSGWDVFDKVGGHCSNVIILTNHSSEPFRSEARSRGVAHFFDKSNEFDLFLEKLQEMSDTSDPG